uniref:Uncharacterized protein n=1 Tax=Sphaerodactylus townsendi TaxID=933632 RepID=A0ACB8EFH0_9SAUR
MAFLFSQKTLEPFSRGPQTNVSFLAEISQRSTWDVETEKEACAQSTGKTEHQRMEEENIDHQVEVLRHLRGKTETKEKLSNKALTCQTPLSGRVPLLDNLKQGDFPPLGLQCLKGVKDTELHCLEKTAGSGRRIAKPLLLVQKGKEIGWLGRARRSESLSSGRLKFNIPIDIPRVLYCETILIRQGNGGTRSYRPHLNGSPSWPPGWVVFEEAFKEVTATASEAGQTSSDHKLRHSYMETKQKEYGEASLLAGNEWDSQMEKKQHEFLSGRPEQEERKGICWNQDKAKGQEWNMKMEEQDPANLAVEKRLEEIGTSHHVLQAGSIGEFSQRKPGDSVKQEPREGLLQQWEVQWQEFLKTVEFPLSRWAIPQLPEKPSPWEDTKAFLASFEQVAEACQWPREEWVTQLLPALRGEAEQTFSSLDAQDRKDYGKMPLREAVGSIFGGRPVPSENDQMQLSIDVKEEEEGDASLLEEDHLNEEAARETLSERAESEELKENFWNPDVPENQEENLTENRMDESFPCQDEGFHEFTMQPAKQADKIRNQYLDTGSHTVNTSLENLWGKSQHDCLAH